MSRPPISVRIPTLVLSLLLPAAGIHAQVDRQEGLQFFDTGPLRIRDQFLPSSGFLELEPTSADVLDAGRWQVDVVINGTNNWAQSKEVQRVQQARGERLPMTLEDLRAIEAEEPGKGIYLVDGEVYRTSVSLRVGLGKGIQIALTLPFFDFGSGFGDSIIEEFHDTFGFSQSGRLGVPQDSYTVYIRDAEGNELFRSTGPGAELGNVQLGVKGRIPVGSDAWRVALEGVAKLDTGDEEILYSSGSEDVGLQALVTRYFKRSCIHLGVGARHLGHSELFNLESQTLFSGLVAYEQGVSRSLSFIGQMTVSESPFQDLEINELDNLAVLVDVGFKKGINSRYVFFFAFSENFSTFGSSPDVGFHAGLTVTL